jgi:hypothetical protein
VASARHQNTAFEARVVLQRDAPELDPKLTFGCTFVWTNCRSEQTATSARRPMLGSWADRSAFPERPLMARTFHNLLPQRHRERALAASTLRALHCGPERWSNGYKLPAFA